MGFKDFENKVKDVKGQLQESHREAVEQSIVEKSDSIADTQ